MSLKEEVAEEACSHLSLADPLGGLRAAAADTNKQQLYHQITRTVSGHKRSVPATAAAARTKPSQRACRELFIPHDEQAGPSARPGVHPSEQAPRSPLAEANAAVDARRATPAQVAQPSTFLPPALCAPVADPCSLLLSNSGQVLHSRLSSSNLLPSTTAAGQQLLQLEVQLQALLGIRQHEEGTNNICWVDHGFLHYPQGTLHFYRMYGDAECAQVSCALLSSHVVCCETVFSENTCVAI